MRYPDIFTEIWLIPIVLVGLVDTFPFSNVPLSSRRQEQQTTPTSLHLLVGVGRFNNDDTPAYAKTRNAIVRSQVGSSLWIVALEKPTSAAFLRMLMPSTRSCLI